MRNVDVGLVKGQVLFLCSLGQRNTSVSTLGERTNENPILAVLFISDVKGTEHSEQDATLF